MKQPGADQPEKIISFKDEGDFFTLKLTQEGAIPDDGKLYPFGSLVTRAFYSPLECKMFAASIGYKYEIA